MTIIDEREKGFEAKYKLDQENEFKIRSLRNKLLGLWAAEKLNPPNVDEYVKEVRLSDLEKPGDDDIIDKLTGDFQEKSMNINKEEIVEKIKEFESQARREILDNKEKNSNL